MGSGRKRPKDRALMPTTEGGTNLFRRRYTWKHSFHSFLESLILVFSCNRQKPQRPLSFKTMIIQRNEWRQCACKTNMINYIPNSDKPRRKNGPHKSKPCKMWDNKFCPSSSPPKKSTFQDLSRDGSKRLGLRFLTRNRATTEFGILLCHDVGYNQKP